MKYRCVVAVLPFVVLTALPARAAATVQDNVQTDTTVVLIVRHAERVSDAPNSDLSAAGLARANAIAATAQRLGVNAVYATDFCRAAQTAQPAALALDLPVRVTATGSADAGLDGCAPEIAARRDSVAEPTPDGIAQRVLEEQPGRVVLVVGHSNTVPAIATSLGAQICPDLLATDASGRCWLTEDRYDDLFIVRVPGDGGAAQAELQTQGRHAHHAPLGPRIAPPHDSWRGRGLRALAIGIGYSYGWVGHDSDFAPPGGLLDQLRAGGMRSRLGCVQGGLVGGNRSHRPDRLRDLGNHTGDPTVAGFPRSRTAA